MRRCTVAAHPPVKVRGTVDKAMIPRAGECVCAWRTVPHVRSAAQCRHWEPPYDNIWRGHPVSRPHKPFALPDMVATRGAWGVSTAKVRILKFFQSTEQRWQWLFVPVRPLMSLMSHPLAWAGATL